MRKSDKLVNIAFAGKRKIIGLEKIITPFNQLFAAFDKSFQSHQFNFISGLADGADQTVSEIFINGDWMDKSSTNTRTMKAVIAFSKEDYLHTIKNKQGFERLYGQCNQKLQLDGKLVKGTKGKSLRLRAHRQQANVLSRIGDLLIAVASIDEETRVSVTVETIISCLHNCIPVIVLNPDDNQFYFYNDIEEWLGHSQKPGSALEVINAYLDTLIENKGKSITDDPGSFSENVKLDFLFWLREKTWNFYDSLFINGIRPNPDVQIPLSNKYDEPLSTTIVKRRKLLSNYSNYCQLQYRGAYVLNYALAIAAVVCAIASIVVYIYIKVFHIDELWSYAILVLGLIKVMLIVAMLRNTKEVNSKLYNRNAIDYRYASELMRVNYYLSLFGILKAPAPVLGNHTKSYLFAYAGEILYKYNMRELSTIPYDIKLSQNLLPQIISTIKEDWFISQNRYHRTEINKMKSMHYYLEKYAEVVGKVLLAIVIIELPIIIMEILYPKDSFLLTPLLMGFATLAPAIVTTLNSIKFQTEAKKMLFRSQLIKAEMAKPYHELTKIEKMISNPSDADFQGSYFMNVLNQIDCMAAIMIDEVAEWSMLYEKLVDEQG